ncbi:hypothetical protein [Mesorhizobium sp. M0199]|uniref:hypothetical protein n=1 Tax=Mesorhizobium sp. M0199 TaxID=2956911 RepID=UPI00333B46A1
MTSISRDEPGGLSCRRGRFHCIYCMVLWGINNPGRFTTLSSAEGARGLLTFLFASSATGVIVLVAVSTFWMGPEDVKLRFPLGKDLLAIITGVLGTILGFYYGSAGFGTAAPQALTISELPWNQESLPSGSKASIAGKLSGGTPPYQVELRYQPCWVEQVTKSLPTIAKVNGTRSSLNLMCLCLPNPKVSWDYAPMFTLRASMLQPSWNVALSAK